MTLKSTVETLTHTAVNTAVAAVRDPRGTATKATGLVLDTAGAGIGLVRNRIGGVAERTPAPVKEVAEEITGKVEDVSEKVADRAEEAVAKVEEGVARVEEGVARVEKAVPAKKAPAAKKTPAPKPAATEDPRDHIPGPDLVAFAPPAPEDLPEPIVIEAE